MTITASQRGGPDAAQTFTLTVNAAPAITSGNATTFTERSAGTFTVSSNGAPTPAVAETGPLPSGVTFTDNGDGTATLAGSPAPGTGHLRAVHHGQQRGGQQRRAVIHPDGQRGTGHHLGRHHHLHRQVAGTFTIVSNGAPTPTVSKTGTLPSGVTFVHHADGTATLSGTPAVGTSGNYVLTITASNGVGSNAVQTFTLTINSVPKITSKKFGFVQRGQRRRLHGPHHRLALPGHDRIGRAPQRCDVQRRR